MIGQLHSSCALHPNKERAVLVEQEAENLVKRKLLNVWAAILNHPANGLVTIPTELFWLHYFWKTVFFYFHEFVNPHTVLWCRNTFWQSKVTKLLTVAAELGLLKVLFSKYLHDTATFFHAQEKLHKR